MNINPREIRGKWRVGWALDFHTRSSTRLPDGRFDNEYTELGALLHTVKYYGDKRPILPIAETAAKFIKKELAVDGILVHPHLESIVPIPPSDTTRDFQPVFEIAREMGKILSLRVDPDYLIKTRQTLPHKNLESNESGREQLNGAFEIRSQSRNYRCILLFDDIYRSGETLTEATRVLHKDGNIHNKNRQSRVFVITLTQTRTRR